MSPDAEIHPSLPKSCCLATSASRPSGEQPDWNLQLDGKYTIRFYHNALGMLNFEVEVSHSSVDLTAAGPRYEYSPWLKRLVNAC